MRLGFYICKAGFALGLSGSRTLHAPRSNIGKMKRELVSREFGAIYVDRVAVARTDCKVRGRTDKRMRDFGKNVTIWNCFKLRKNRIWGYESGKTRPDYVGGATNLTRASANKYFCFFSHLL